MSLEPADWSLVAALGANLRYIEELEARYAADPKSVDPALAALLRGATLPAAAPTTARPGGAATGAATEGPPHVAGAPELAFAVRSLIEAYRCHGHLAVQLDPLGLSAPIGHPDLLPENHGLSAPDLERPAPGGLWFGGRAGEQPTVGELHGRLQKAYGQLLGVEMAHITDPARRRFLQERLEPLENPFVDNRAAQLRILDRLIEAEVLEQFLHTKYVGAKRFSLEGGKALIPLLDFLVEFAGESGVEEIVLGMAHRGRLNVLANLMGKSPRQIFAEFDDLDPLSVMGSSDVKYHMGYSTDVRSQSGHKLHLSLAFNPSHLEAVDPVVVGRVRAKQRRHGDVGRQRVLGVLIHGDAAFAGQGLVAETLNLSGLEGYRTGGTIHIIINNQIGFTTNPTDSRSTHYCTDIAKMLEVPVFHVNGAYPEQVVYATQLAMAYRQAFHTDVVIDMVCFRRYGHNESDEPGFTQPLMYQKIERQPSERQLYSSSLVARSVVAESEVAELMARKNAALEEELRLARNKGERPRVEWMTGVWAGYCGGADASVPDVDTAVPKERLQEVARSITTLPPHFTPHPKIERLLQQRAAMGRGDVALDWGMGEHLAFASLLADKVLVRVSGQDSRRGTFSQRHAVIYDRQNGTPYAPLAHLRDDPKQQGVFHIIDSALSEAGVLGFEYGYSLDYPDGLVIWEAQFGDFVNGAQVILDQFVSSAEDKWRRLSGLVMLLPHGYEGQGPEHSSARFERFLQLCAEDNMQVVYPTTPAQYFHLLRRQVLRPWRKPLVVMSPKSLLRHPAATSMLTELSSGRFNAILGDESLPPADVKRAILCTGKVYYDLLDSRTKRGDRSTALLRIEQLYPLRMGELKAALDRFPNLGEIIWVQEEPANMGALNFIVPRLQPLALRLRFRAVSRVESASPATGSHKAHVLEQQALMNDAFADFTEAGAAAKLSEANADGTPRPTVTLVLTAVGSEGTK
jgi:2-oxoglutarate dehydrogenase E1 component